MAATRTKSTKRVPIKKARASPSRDSSVTSPKPAAVPKKSAKLPETEKAGGSGFAVGQRIMHRTFGPGTVLSIDGEKLEIKFKAVGTKWIIDSFVTPGKAK